MRKSGFIHFNFRRLYRFRSQLRAATRGRPRGPMKACFRQWGAMYLAETKTEFVKNSRGGGDWPELAESTRRSRGDKSKAAILRDTGTLFGALNIGSPGNLYKIIKGGIRVGFGGPSKHSDGDATIADIARIHNKGGGDIPKRQILDKPSNRLVGRMAQTLRVAMNRMGHSL